LNPEKGLTAGEPFQGYYDFFVKTQGCRCASTAGLRLANAFGVNSNYIISDFEVMLDRMV
jgi:hypothetical protein